MIGKSVPRVDAYEKVTGRAKFTEDLIPPRCLVAKVLHASIGNGIVTSIDTSEAEALEGVVKVVTFKDVPEHCYPTPGHPWSVEPAHQDVADRIFLRDVSVIMVMILRQLSQRTRSRQPGTETDQSGI